MDIFKGTNELQPYLDYRWKRHKIILSNIANADTPNYRAKDVVFIKELKGMIPLKTTREKHITPSKVPRIEVRDIERRLVGNDKNNVSIEEEMAKLTQNRIAYEVYMKMSMNGLNKLKNTIREGK